MISDIDKNLIRRHRSTDAVHSIFKSLSFLSVREMCLTVERAFPVAADFDTSEEVLVWLSLGSFLATVVFALCT